MRTTTANAYDPKGRRKYLSRTEGQKFLLHASALPREKAAFCFTIYYTGCRISEAIGLSKNDVEAETNVLRIRTLKKRGKIVIRRIPVPESLVRCLLDLDPLEGDHRLWSFSRTTGWRIIKSVMAAASIAGIQATTKGLRHGFGVRGALGQIPVNVIQTWMGHADLTTTAIYLAVQDEEARELIGRTW